MSEKKPPKIEFPCENYLIKVMGDAHEEVHEFVIATTEEFSPGFDRSKVSVKGSSKGTFQSITVYITATGVDQLEAYHQALIAHPKIKMVL